MAPKLPGGRFRAAGLARAIQGNFDHIMGIVKNLGDAHNLVVDDIEELADGASVSTQQIAEHTHDAIDTTPVSHNDLTNVTANQHHAEAHHILSAAHSDSDSADTPVAGDALTWDGSKWVADTADPEASGHSPRRGARPPAMYEPDHEHEQWIAPPGSKGDAGAAGATGATGSAGATGAAGGQGPAVPWPGEDGEEGFFMPSAATTGASATLSDNTPADVTELGQTPGVGVEASRDDHVHDHGTGYAGGHTDVSSHDHSNASNGDDILNPTILDAITAVTEDELDVGGRLILSGSINPSISSNQNNYHTAGMDTSAIADFVVSGTCDLTGIDPKNGTRPAEGMVYLIQSDETSTNTVTLKHQSVSSLSANRFELGGADLPILPGQSALLRYTRQGASGKWFLVAYSGATAGATGATGATGAQGTPGIPGVRDDDGEPFFLPGPKGDTGATGATGPAGATLLDDLSDVVITSASAGQELMYDGSNWVNSTPDPLFGDGSDSSLHFTGSGGTIAGATLSGSTYTMTRDIYATDITIDSGVILKGLYRIFCTGTLTNNGTIDNSGGDASGTTAGAATARGFWAPSGSGAAGAASNNTTVAGSNSGTSVGANGTLVAFGGTGGLGGNLNGGAGGSYGAPSNIQDTAARRSASELISGLFVVSAAASTGPLSTAPSAAAIGSGCGGAGGGRTTGGTAAASGAGGGGGGVVLISARYINNASGIIQAKGGNGSSATGGTCSTGGGGGGGGGTVILIYKKLTVGTESVAKGTKGAGLNGASAAADGVAGNLIEIAV